MGIPFPFRTVFAAAPSFCTHAQDSRVALLGPENVDAEVMQFQSVTRAFAGAVIDDPYLTDLANLHMDALARDWFAEADRQGIRRFDFRFENGALYHFTVNKKPDLPPLAFGVSVTRFPFEQPGLYAFCKRMLYLQNLFTNDAHGIVTLQKKPVSEGGIEGAHYDVAPWGKRRQHKGMIVKAMQLDPQEKAQGTLWSQKNPLFAQEADMLQNDGDHALWIRYAMQYPQSILSRALWHNSPKQERWAALSHTP